MSLFAGLGLAALLVFAAMFVALGGAALVYDADDQFPAVMSATALFVAFAAGTGVSETSSLSIPVAALIGFGSEAVALFCAIGIAYPSLGRLLSFRPRLPGGQQRRTSRQIGRRLGGFAYNGTPPGWLVHRLLVTALDAFPDEGLYARYAEEWARNLADVPIGRGRRMWWALFVRLSASRTAQMYEPSAATPNE